MFWFPTVDIKITTQKRGVNNERVFAEVDTYVMEVIRMDLGEWLDETHRQQSTIILDDVIYDYSMYEEKIIPESIRVICDYRNNDQESFDKGLVTISIYYQQYHCLNTTELVYTIDLSAHIWHI